MATAKGGLPAGFNFNVSSDDLVGKPVQVGGYLDEDPMLELIKAQCQARGSASAATFVPPVAPLQAPLMPEPRREKRAIDAGSRGVSARYTAAEGTGCSYSDELGLRTATNSKGEKGVTTIRRLQINLAPDSERQVNELLEIISAQSAEKNIMFSEILNALILNLYEARTDLNVSRVPLRGKWGSSNC